MNPVAIARTIDTAFLTAPFLEYLHVYYPPLVTNLYAFASMAAGSKLLSSSIGKVAEA